MLGLLTSCSMMVIEEDNIWDISYNKEFKNIYDINVYVNNNWKYRKDIDNQKTLEFNQTPQESWDTMTGDCEDKVILILSLIYSSFGIEGELILRYNPENIFEGHASFIVEGRESNVSEKCSKFYKSYTLKELNKEIRNHRYAGY